MASRDDLARRLRRREAHGIVGRLVAHCEEQGTELPAISRETAREFHPLLDTDLGEWLDPVAAVERRTSRGGTAWPEVQRQLELLRGRSRG